MVRLSGIYIYEIDQKSIVNRSSKKLDEDKLMKKDLQDNIFSNFPQSVLY